jgi:ParB-like chromosome segregation protein Spo0J
MTLGAQQKIKRQDKLIRLDELKPYEFNNRNHPAEQVEMIAKSLQEFGWTNPILVDEDMSIIAGHGRWQGAKHLGMTEAPCVILTGLTEEKKRAYRILDNKLTEDSSWAMDNLSLEVGWLEDQGFDVAEWGLDELVEGWNEDEGKAQAEKEGKVCPECGAVL